MEINLSTVDEIIDKYDLVERGLIPSLLEIQDRYHYLPHEALEYVAERMRIPLIQINQVAEFYKAFSLEPRGKHIITVCQGTACHVEGGGRLIEQVGRLLDIQPGETTSDLNFSLEAVNCLGCCALGPVMTVDGKYYGHMNASKVEKALESYQEMEAVANV